MKTLKLKKGLLLLSITFLITSCLNNVEENSIVEEDNAPDPCADITFSKNVKPIIDANCVQCHGNGGTFPNLTSYNSIMANAGSVKSEVASRRMPRGGSLSQEEINAIVCWVDGGALEN